MMNIFSMVISIAEILTSYNAYCFQLDQTDNKVEPTKKKNKNRLKTTANFTVHFFVFRKSGVMYFFKL